MEQSSPIPLNQDQKTLDGIELPHNLEAEQQLLGALIKNNELIDRVSQNGLKGMHFFEPFHEEIYEKIIQMNNNGKSVTILFLKTLFESNENFDSDSYFINLVANAAHSLVIKEVANEIYELSLRRQLIYTAEFLEHSSYALNEDKNVAEIIEDTEMGQPVVEIAGRNDFSKLISPIINKNTLFSADLIHSSMSPLSNISKAKKANGTDITFAVALTLNNTSVGVSGVINNLSVGDALYNSDGDFIGLVSVISPSGPGSYTLEFGSCATAAYGSQLYVGSINKHYTFKKALSSSATNSNTVSSIEGASEAGSNAAGAGSE